jgi:hypothetical protein
LAVDEAFSIPAGRFAVLQSGFLSDSLHARVGTTALVVVMVSYDKRHSFLG